MFATADVPLRIVRVRELSPGAAQSIGGFSYDARLSKTRFRRDRTRAPCSPARDFDSHDVNRDGRLTLGEFMRLMENSDEEMTTEECQTAFDEIDTDNDGLIDFAHLLAWWNERA